jgi:hypothetical protein
LPPPAAPPSSADQLSSGPRAQTTNGAPRFEPEQLDYFITQERRAEIEEEVSRNVPRGPCYRSTRIAECWPGCQARVVELASTVSKGHSQALSCMLTNQENDDPPVRGLVLI